ncbi:hypothetical protein NBRC116597_15220 [Phaeobacter sp. NW0010-22]
MNERPIPLGKSYFDFTTYEPFGGSVQIIPWNYPVEMTAPSLSGAMEAVMPVRSKRRN